MISDAECDKVEVKICPCIVKFSPNTHVQIRCEVMVLGERISFSFICFDRSSPCEFAPHFSLISGAVTPSPLPDPRTCASFSDSFNVVALDVLERVEKQKARMSRGARVAAAALKALSMVHVSCRRDELLQQLSLGSRPGASKTKLCVQI